MRITIKNSFSLLLTGVVLLLLAGCVTEVTGGRQLDVDPEKAKNSHIELGLVYLRQGDRDRARMNFQKALQFDPDSAEALHGMAMLFQMEKELALAEQFFKKSIRENRQFSRARNNYGVFLSRQERYEEAYEQFRLAAANTDYDRRADAMVSAAVTARKLGKTDVVEEFLERSLALNSSNPNAVEELVDWHFSQGEYEQAQTYLNYYRRIGRANARILWLGVRLSQIANNTDSEASYVNALRNMFGDSEEYKAYLRNKDQTSEASQ